jgi:hypothetical protein
MSSASCTDCGNIFPDRYASGEPVGLDPEGRCYPCVTGIRDDDDEPTLAPDKQEWRMTMAHRAKHRKSAAQRRTEEGTKHDQKKPAPARQLPGSGSIELPVSKFLRDGVK